MPLKLFNDITTTPDSPPEFRALEREGRNVDRDMKYPPSFAQIQRKSYPKLIPLHSDLSADKLFELVQAAALEMSHWEIASVESTRLSLEAVATSRLLRLKYDIVIQVRPDEQGSSVHMRCKSRLGGAGTGAKRICGFFKRLFKKLQ